MKTIIFFSILFSVITLPALGELTEADLNKIRLMLNNEDKGGLTEADLNKIRLIVNDSEKRIKADMKADIASVKKELKEDIATSERNLIRYINENIKRLDNEINSVNDKVTFLAYLVYALIALIVVAIAIPQFIMTWRSGRERSLEKQVETLVQEVETLKQRIVNP